MDDYEFLDQKLKNRLSSSFSKIFYRKENTVKRKFISLWDKLGDIYRRYHKKLEELGGDLPTKVCSTETLLNNLNRIH